MKREYFDAKFDGLEKLMASQQENLEKYIGAVSTNVKRVEDDLSTHKESPEAHGMGAFSRSAAGIVAWTGLALSVALLLV